MTRPDAPFLRAICDKPDDDAPRLIYADWLDENGAPERAEFIRVQCELAKFDRNPPCPEPHHRPKDDDPGCAYWMRETYALRRREREMLGANRAEWTYGCFPKAPGDDRRWLQDRGPVVAVATRLNAAEVEFARGFIDSITCTGADCIAHLDAIREEHPVREVRLTTMPDDSPHERYGDLGHVLLALEDGRLLSEWKFNAQHETAWMTRRSISGWGRDEMMMAACRGRWPGVTFHLPALRTDPPIPPPLPLSFTARDLANARR